MGLVDTETRGTGLGDDDITLSEELAELVPHPLLLQWGRWVAWWVLWDSGWDGDWDVTLSGLRDVLQKSLESELHLDTWEGSHSDLNVVGVELDDVSGLVGVREGTGVEVRQQSTDGQDQVSGLDSLLNGWVGQGTNVDTTESWVVLVDGTLTHRGDEGWELGQLNELLGLGLDVVSGGTGISQDNWVLSVPDHVQDGLDNLSLGLWVVRLQGQVNWSLQQVSWDHHVDNVSWQTQVDWSLGDVTGTDQPVDLSWSSVDVSDHSSSLRDVSRHSVEDSEVTVTQSVVQQELLSLRGKGWNTDDVHDTDVLGVRTGNTVQSGQLTDTESGDQTSHTLNSGVTVSSVGGVQLVGVTGPSHAWNLVDLVQKGQVEVTWQTEDGGDVDLLKSLEEVSTQGNLRHFLFYLFNPSDMKISCVPAKTASCEKGTEYCVFSIFSFFVSLEYVSELVIQRAGEVGDELREEHFIGKEGERLRLGSHHDLEILCFYILVD